MRELSVITVTKDDPEGLLRTHQSLAAQTTSAFEWIIQDGGLEHRPPPALPGISVVYCNEKDAGIYDGMNRAIVKSGGRWLLFLNSGDELASDTTLEQLLQGAASEDDVVYGDTIYVGPDGDERYVTARGHAQTLNRLPYCHQSALFRRSLLAGRPYETQYRIVGDYEFMVRCYLERRVFRYLEMPVAKFRMDGVSSTRDLARHLEAALVVERAVGCADPGLVETMLLDRLGDRILPDAALRKVAESNYYIYGTGQCCRRLLERIRELALVEPAAILDFGTKRTEFEGIPLIDIARGAVAPGAIVLASRQNQALMLEKIFRHLERAVECRFVCI